MEQVKPHQAGTAARATGVLLVGGGVVVFCVLAFVELSRNVASGVFDTIDHRVLEWFVSIRTPWWNEFFLSATNLGSFVIMAVLTLGVSVGLLLARHRGSAVALIASMLGTLYLSSALKVVVGRPRPPELTRLWQTGGDSFPSGHTISGFAFFVTIALLSLDHVKGRALKLWILSFALLLGTLVAISRMYLGVHYLSDVVGGALVGIGWPVTVVLAEHVWRHRGRRAVGERGGRDVPAASERPSG
jgi:undecaprenyl-diphosphatase